MAGLNRLIEMLFSSPALKEPLCADGKGCFFSRGAAAVVGGRFMSRPAEGEEGEEEEQGEGDDDDRERRVLFQPEAEQLRDLLFNEIERGSGESVAVLLDIFEQLLDLFPVVGTVLLYRREWSLSQERRLHGAELRHGWLEISFDCKLPKLMAVPVTAPSVKLVAGVTNRLEFARYSVKAIVLVPTVAPPPMPALDDGSVAPFEVEGGWGWATPESQREEKPRRPLILGVPLADYDDGATDGVSATDEESTASQPAEVEETDEKPARPEAEEEEAQSELETRAFVEQEFRLFIPGVESSGLLFGAEPGPIECELSGLNGWQPILVLLEQEEALSEADFLPQLHAKATERLDSEEELRLAALVEQRGLGALLHQAKDPGPLIARFVLQVIYGWQRSETEAMTRVGSSLQSSRNEEAAECGPAVTRTPCNAPVTPTPRRPPPITEPKTVPRQHHHRKVGEAIERLVSFLNYEPCVIAPASSTVGVAWETRTIRVWTTCYDLLWTALSLWDRLKAVIFREQPDSPLSNFLAADFSIDLTSGQPMLASEELSQVSARMVTLSLTRADRQPSEEEAGVVTETANDVVQAWPHLY
jgi:hypothetical protein